MLNDLQIDTTELDRLKGISIGTTDDDRLFLILTYRKKSVAANALPWIFWSVVAVLFCICGLVIWWM